MTTRRLQAEVFTDRGTRIQVGRRRWRLDVLKPKPGWVGTLVEGLGLSSVIGRQSSRSRQLVPLVVAHDLEPFPVPRGLEELARPVEAPPDRRVRGADDLGDFLAAEALDVAQ